MWVTFLEGYSALAALSLSASTVRHLFFFFFFSAAISLLVSQNFNVLFYAPLFLYNNEGPWQSD